MSNYPNYNAEQYLRAADFNANELTTLSAQHDTNARFHYNGVVNPASATYSMSGMVVTANLPSPFCVAFGSGALTYAHGTATNADTQTYAVDFTSLVPGSGTVIVYLIASSVIIKQNPFTVIGPPPGHRAYDPTFVPYTAYYNNVESLALTASTTAPDNVATFELGRTVLSAGETTITSFDVSHVLQASSLLAPTGVAPGTYNNATVTVGLDGRVTSIAQGQQFRYGTILVYGPDNPTGFAFSTPFPNACLAIVISYQATFPPNTGAVGAQLGDNAHFLATNSNNGANGCIYIAIGY